MTNRTCIKCGDTLIANEKLNLMECVSGKHVEPVNMVRAQWWNHCPKCGQTGTNDRDGEARWQLMKKVDVETNGKFRTILQPVTKEIGDKKFSIVFEENTSQVPCTCKACGHKFTKL